MFAVDEFEEKSTFSSHVGINSKKYISKLHFLKSDAFVSLSFLLNVKRKHIFLNVIYRYVKNVHYVLEECSIHQVPTICFSVKLNGNLSHENYFVLLPLIYLLHSVCVSTTQSSYAILLPYLSFHALIFFFHFPISSIVGCKIH